MARDFAFLPIRPYYFSSETGVQDYPGDAEFVGPNPSNSAMICYYLKNRHIFGDMYIELYDTQGKFMKKLPAGTRKGINIIQIATVMDPPKVPKSPNILGDAAFGPEYESGSYMVKVVKGNENYTTNLMLNDVKNQQHSAEDRRLQRETLMKSFNMLEKLAAVDQQILNTRDSLKAKISALKGSGLKRIQIIIADCEKMHEQISATQPGEGGIAGQVRLRENIAEIYGAVGSYRGRPTNLQIKALELYDVQVKDFASKINMIIKSGRTK
jgi:hypothetical protein